MDFEMTVIILILLMFMVGFFSLWTYYITPQLKKGKQENAVYIIIIAVVSAIIHIVCAFKYEGHATDMNCFTAWADMIYQGGIGNFYSSDAFTDYPPGYMYILYVVGALKQLFGISGGAQWLIVKMPAIICDIITGVLIYKIAAKKFDSGISSAIAGMYLFNPAVILNSSLWGQVDSVYTLAVVLMTYMLSRRELIKSYYVFALCIFIKPQAFMFMPLIIFAIIENIFLPGFNVQKFLKNLIWGLGAILMIVLLSLPFGFENVLHQYTETLASYPYLTINAFNLWGALGQNWTQLTAITNIAGYGVLVLIVAYAAYIFFKTKHEGKYYFCGAVLSLATFMFSTKMHDRYAFPVMVLLLMTFICKIDVKVYIMYALTTLMQFFNTAWVLFIYEQDINLYYKSPVIIVASIINLMIFAYFIYITHNSIINQAVTNVNAAKVSKTNNKSNNDGGKHMKFKLTQHYEKLNKFDYIAMAVIIVVYGFIAFYNLGDTKAPQTFTNIGTKNVEIDLGEEKEISQLRVYLGSYQLDDNRKLCISYLDKDGNNIYTQEENSGAVFYWSMFDVNVSARYIILKSTDKNLSIMEIGIIDSDKNKLTPANISDPDVMPMFDEQDLIPERATYLNSTYFDEIYHARTGYEFVHGLDVYEWTHPPLGKDIIALGIKIFGMTPFGWRVMGTLFGVLMIPAIYLFARRLLKKQWLSVITCLLFTFDFMHFAQTRIATIDVYVTFFIILMYYFMYKYCTMSFYDTPVKKTLKPLALCGISMGLGVASKWTGIYAGVGLAVIFFISIYRRYSEYLYAKKNPSGVTNGISHKKVIESFAPNLRITILWCCIFFVFVPILIYGLSYIPYLNAPSSNGISTIIKNQGDIFAYHSKTVVESTHPYSSKWYEWIIMERPIWYYSGTISSEIKEGISSFGNPLVWWIGIPALFMMIYRVFAYKDKKALFLTIAYVIQLVFWIPVTRTTFIYHYFPCVPFLVLMIGYCIDDIYQGAANKKSVIILSCVYAAAVIGMFLMFYPVLSGAPCSVEYAQNYLKWFDSWVLL